MSGKKELEVLLRVLVLATRATAIIEAMTAMMGGMQDGVDRDAALLAATFAEREDVVEDVEVMEDDSDEADDIPTIKVGGEEYEITDVTHEIIARMTTEETERYNQ